jgi:hypothetical protein
MSKQAKSSLQAGYAFALTKSDSADVVADANNIYQYPWVYVHVTGASGAVQITPADGQSAYSILTALNSITGGSGYQNGTFNSIQLVAISGTLGQPCIANIVVASGAVTTATYVSGGVGADSTTIYGIGDRSLIGGGSGFQVTSTVNASATDKVIVYGVQGNVLGGDMPIMVKRVWAANTAAGNLVAFVGRGGSF